MGPETVLFADLDLWGVQGIGFTGLVSILTPIRAHVRVLISLLITYLLSPPTLQVVRLWPRAGAQRGFSFPCLSPGPQQKKKTPWVVFFFFALAPCRHGASPSPAFPRSRSKKNTLGGVFFCCGPARTLTHSLRAWVAMPPPRRGGVCFFCCGAGPDRGGVFFFCCGPARTLTHSLWAGAISARPGWCFLFCCGPAGSF